MSGGTPLGNMVIKLGLDDADFGKGVENSKKQVRYLAKEMQANMKIADMAGNQLGKLGTRYDGLTKIIGAQEKQVQALKKAYDESFVDGKATDSTKRLAAQLQDANGKLANYKQQLINTAGAMAEYKVRNEGFTGAINKASDSLIKNGQTMENYGGKLTKGVTLPLVAGAAVVTKAAMDWESAFAGTKKTVDEVVDSNGRVTYSYKDLENGLRELARTLPSSHKEIAATAEVAGQLGIQTPKIVSFTETMIGMGVATTMSAEESATAMARFANITNMSQDDFERLGSVIVELGNNMATTEGEITAMSLRLAGAGHQVGMTEAEIVSFAAALSSVGIEAEAGGSAFSKVMIQMQLATEKGTVAFDELINLGNQSGVSFDQMSYAVQKGGNTLKATAGQMGLTNKQLSSMYKEADKSAISLQNFAEVAGMTNAEFGNMFKNDPSKAIMKFVEGLAHAEEKGKSAIAVLDDMDITEVRLRDSLLRAANASGVFSEAVEMGNKAWKENTALAEEVGKRYETVESQLDTLKGNVNDVAITLGGPLLSALNSGIQASKPFVETMADLATKFSELDPKTQRTIIGFVGAAAAAGPLLSLTGKLSSGIGGLGKAFVDLKAKSVKKKAIAELSAQLVSGAVDVDTLATALGGGATKLGLFGGAASKASGAAGVGAMTTSLGALSPVLLGVVGVGGALALGYGAWKIWGEEAYNAGQRTKRWGSDVGSATDEALTKFQSYSQGAIGEMSLVEQGISGNTESIVGNFAKMGESIETEMTGRIEALKEMVKTLPQDIQGAAEELTNDEISNQEKRLAIVQKNNDKITQIRQNASNNNRKITYEETVRIKALAEESAEAYVVSLGKSEAETKQILSAMTGNVETASKEQASSWIQSLGKQRQNSKAQYSQMRKDMETELVGKGYDLNSGYAKKMLDLLETSSKAATQLTEDQMSLILGKYPELADEIFLANGQLISSMGDAGKSAVLQNKEMMRSFENMSSTAAKSIEENAKKIDLVANEANDFGEFWNGLVLDPKTGSVKTNAQEEVNKAAESEAGWNRLMWLGKSADISSNAKLMIAEAAIANGKWDSMTFTDQQALLESNATKTITQALQVKGDWDNMNFEQKKAIVYSNSPEAVAETLMNLGLWDAYQPEIKELDAKNYQLLETISQSEDKMKDWGSLPVEVKEIIGENYDFLNKVYSSEEEFNRWKSIPNETKEMLATNEDLLVKLFESENGLNQYNALSPLLKTLIADGPAKLTIDETKQALEQYNGLPEELKTLLAENMDATSKFDLAKSKLDIYNFTNPAHKLLTGDNSSVSNASNQGVNSLNIFNANNPAQKQLTGNASNVVGATGIGGSALNIFANNNPLPKNLKANDNASGPASTATGAVQGFKQQRDHTVTLTTIFKSITEKIFKNAKGTNYHPGGSMIVNDESQSGPIKKELIIRPNGQMFIPEGRNVYLPNEPIGTKVVTASRTKSLMNRMGVPRYAQGVGVPKNSTLVKDLESVSNKQDNNPSSNINVSVDNNSEQLDELIYVVKKLSSDLKNMKIVMKEREVGSILTNIQNQSEKLKMRLAGERV